MQWNQVEISISCGILKVKENMLIGDQYMQFVSEDMLNKVINSAYINFLNFDSRILRFKRITRDI